MHRVLSAGSSVSGRAPERTRDRAQSEQVVRARVDRLAEALRESVVSGRLVGSDADRSVRELACAAEGLTSITVGHIDRLGRYVGVLADSLGWPEARRDLLTGASRLHDVGKVGVADEVLSNEGRYTGEDRLVMERHAAVGHDLLAGHDSPLLDLAAVIALSHHERYDGTGYPNGLRDRAIPIEGRIVAIADVFDALTTERRYKPAMTLNQARVLMLANRGTHFDPTLLDAFFEQEEELERIRRSWRGSPLHGSQRTESPHR